MALFPQTPYLIAGAYNRLAQLGLEYVRILADGYGNSAKAKDKRAILISSTKLFRHLMRFTRYDSAGNFLGTNRITDDQFNAILRLLISTADVNALPASPKLLFTVGNYTVSTGGQGPPGANGQSAYLYLGYADDAAGSNFSTSPGTRPYIAIVNSATPLTVVVGIFAGLWTKYIGTNGAPGGTGPAGTTYYLHIGWADDVAGLGYTAVFNATKKYVAFVINTTAGDPGVGAFTGLWAKYLGDNGTNGTNGNTILGGAGVPPSGLGVNGDYYIDITSDPRLMYGPKTAGAWGSGYSIKGNTGSTGATGSNGADGANGANAFLYVAYADDASGTGFTMTFDPAKTYIAFKSTNIIIALPAVTDFVGLWAKYRGDGDRWSTNSNTTLTIGTGTQVLIVEKNLAYVTGQRVVISVPFDNTKRMEGVCNGYDPIAGQLTVNVDTTYGAGTYSSWDVSLQGAPISIASANGYYATLSTNQGSGGAAQSIPTGFTKLSAWDNILAVSAGMTPSTSTDDITVANRGAYVIDIDAQISGTNGADFALQVFKNGIAVSDLETRVVLDGTGNTRRAHIHGVLSAVAQNDVFDVRAKSASGTNNFLIENGRFSLYTVGAPNTIQFADFGPNAVGLASVICDTFSAGAGNYAVWEVRIKKGLLIRGVRVAAIWDGTNQPNFSQYNTTDLGTIDITLSVDFNAGNIRLKAIGTSTGWDVSGKREIVA